MIGFQERQKPRDRRTHTHTDGQTDTDGRTDRQTGRYGLCQYGMIFSSMEQCQNLFAFTFYGNEVESNWLIALRALVITAVLV